MNRRLRSARFLFVILFAASNSAHAQQGISQDRDLKELDLNKWDCLHRPSGTAKTPDGTERNQLKNREVPPALPTGLKTFDIPGLLKYVGDFDAKTQGKRRKDLVPAERQKLAPLEKEMVQLTGYLGLAYAGPPESTNCGNVDFHDWHMEIVEKPPEHAPRIGDPTAVICEITPRTQTSIFKDGVRIQSLAGFFRNFAFEYEPTGHQAVKVRITGFLLWDDEHNGSADVGAAIQRISPNKYHNPWRKTAWEIHPVIKIEPLEPVTAAPPQPDDKSSSPPPSAPPNDSPEQTPEPTATPSPTPTIPATPTPVALVTLTQPVAIKIPYGQTVLPRGTKLKVVSHDAHNLTVEYLGGNYLVPITSTDFH